MKQQHKVQWLVVSVALILAIILLCKSYHKKDPAEEALENLMVGLATDIKNELNPKDIEQGVALFKQDFKQAMQELRQESQQDKPAHE